MSPASAALCVHSRTLWLGQKKGGREEGEITVTVSQTTTTNVKRRARREYNRSGVAIAYYCMLLTKACTMAIQGEGFNKFEPKKI